MGDLDFGGCAISHSLATDVSHSLAKLILTTSLLTSKLKTGRRLCSRVSQQVRFTQIGRQLLSDGRGNMSVINGQDPYGLAHGLMLDKPRITIPWQSDLVALSNIGEPSLVTSSKVTFVNWKGNTVFNGIEVDVLFRSDFNKIFWLDLRDKSRFESATAAFSYLRQQVIERLGEPHLSQIDDGYPWEQWSYGPVRVSLRIAERFVEYVSFMVSNGL